MTISWHDRFLQQATWTRPLREYIFERAGLGTAQRVLEVGCGTGAILSEMAMRSVEVHGLDREPACLLEARRHAPRSHLTRGDALALPYSDRQFDITFCHFLLLWVADPLLALIEMKRVTRPGGFVLALAEPDYDSRVDRPESLALLGRWQAAALRRQGADAGLGRRLADLFARAGLPVLETGTLEVQKERTPTAAERTMEWQVMEADLAGSVPAGELSRLKMLDEQAWRGGERLLYVPTFFAFSQVQ